MKSRATTTSYNPAGARSLVRSPVWKKVSCRATKSEFRSCLSRSTLRFLLFASSLWSDRTFQEEPEKSPMNGTTGPRGWLMTRVRLPAGRVVLSSAFECAVLACGIWRAFLFGRVLRLRSKGGVPLALIGRTKERVMQVDGVPISWTSP